MPHLKGGHHTKKAKRGRPPKLGLPGNHKKSGNVVTSFLCHGKVK